jgi:hypothetical protein
LAAVAANPSYDAQAIESWRRRRVDRLLSPTGWLTLVDRIVLEEGDNPIPIGTVSLQGGVARLRVRPGVTVTLDGEPITLRVLRSDEDGRPDSLLSGGRIYQLLRRGDAFAVRVKDPLSPARLGFSGLRYFPVDPAWRVRARFERYHPPRQTRHQFDIGAGWVRQVPGIARFEAAGRSASLEPVLEEDSGRLFFVFGDESNRDETCAAGRFLYADLPDGDELVLDFNRAFNPPCAFTPFATCPVLPPQNRLPFRVPAGEKRYEAAHP